MASEIHCKSLSCHFSLPGETGSLVQVNAHTTLKTAVPLMSPQEQSRCHAEKFPAENHTVSVQLHMLKITFVCIRTEVTYAMQLRLMTDSAEVH